MKLKNYIICGLGLLALASCNDYLEVDAPSKYTTDKVYSSAAETSTALNGVYATMLNGSTFGNALYNSLTLNSDVDFAANSQENGLGTAPRRFDTATDNGTVNSLWKALYNSIETANEFIYHLENSDIYTQENSDYADLQQMLGEAKVLRAMCYDELVWYFGDVPFTLEPTFVSNNFLPAITSRDDIRKTLIDDLKSIAENMKFASTLDYGVERVSKEACWAEIARLALNAGGYSLRPGSGYGQMNRPSNYKEFYQTAKEYAAKVIDSNTHSLTASFQNVFVKECNFVVVNDDDPIFEIPFTKETSGAWGYNQGPNCASDGGETSHVWGAASGGAGLSDFYRYSFDSLDVRRDFVNGMWSYTAYGRPAIRASYTQFNNKWSKLWNTIGLGKATTGNTGINFAYLRYTDVLLMFAEADNELNDGPTAEAVAALTQVRNRAFDAADRADKVDSYIAAAADKESFLKAVLDERKWEFAGENMRWKDCVRNNIYNEVVYYSFLRYYGVAENAGSSSQLLELVEQYDNCPDYYQSKMPYSIYYCYAKNSLAGGAEGSGAYGYFPNTGLSVLYLYSPYETAMRPNISPATFFTNNELPYTAISQKDTDGLDSSSSTIEWQEGNFYSWWNENEGCPNDYCLFSFYGYIRGVRGSSTIQIVKDGATTTIDATVAQTAATLPVVRYILPIPEEAITRSEGVYTQQYGY